MIYSRTSEYAIRALGFIALEAKPSGIQEVSRSIGAPPSYVAKIFQRLVHAGILDSKRGAQGGYLLRVNPAHLKLITIIKVIDHVSGSPLSGCVMGFAQCGAKNPCALHEVWSQSKAKIEEKLANTTLLETLEQARHKKFSKHKRIRLSKGMRQVFGQMGLVFFLMVLPSLAKADGPALFADKCAACHTIGQGALAGPDLSPVQAWPVEKLSAKIHEMENFAGPLTPEEVSTLSDFLRAPIVKETNSLPFEPLYAGTIATLLFLGVMTRVYKNRLSGTRRKLVEASKGKNRHDLD